MKPMQRMANTSCPIGVCTIRPFRNRWQDENDIVISVLTRNVKGYLKADGDGGLQVAAFGKKFKWGKKKGAIKVKAKRMDPTFGAVYFGKASSCATSRPGIKKTKTKQPTATQRRAHFGSRREKSVLPGKLLMWMKLAQIPGSSRRPAQVHAECRIMN